ncbi:MAG TPA: transglycosylase domain-containing protein [Verrucomicrobiae bacterium]|nr:transglycosylase domain-containing protein [Verrucomicrobiae bacterium]
MTKPSKRGARGLSVYSNLSANRRSKKDARARQKAEYLASLPKHPVKRFFYRLHPKRFFAFWFSRRGAFLALKIVGVAALFVVLFVGALFAYFRQELNAIRPEEINKRVQTTVTRYYDRNNVLLWEDRGDKDYRLVVESKDISKYMKDATVAIEDRDFYKHNGVSFTGIMRATVNNITGGDTQGGSTLTQQLVKQVFISEEEALARGITGIPRKIKESILAIEVERMFTKDQILTLYMNESPYGGRRNGVESGARTYFGKSAKDLNLAEAALLASIPQQPSRYDPYNQEGHEDLVRRQHTVLDNMASQGYVSKEEAEAAKKIDILDKIRPEADQYKDIRAPHFVQMVRSQLENELGKATVGRGGLTVKTTLDWRVQKVVEQAITNLFNSSLPASANFNNGAATIVDTPTGQILALQGSRNYHHPGYGQDNAAIAFIQPGSTIKPLVFAALFKQKPEGQLNFGAGTVLRDEPINHIYRHVLENYDHRFLGDLTIRQGLAQSRNVPAVKAMYITGRDATIQTIHDMGDKSYCTQGVDRQVQLAAAIGGCGLRQVEHTNAFATFARMGEYKPPTAILEVKNTQGDVIKKWKDEGKQVLDPQVTYMINDILSDDVARAPSFGLGASGLNVPGVKTATKTGTSNIGDFSKDLWMMSYTPRATLGIWVGNNDTSPMSHALSSVVGPTVSEIMGPIHTEIFQRDGSWKPGDWFQRPAGIQTLAVAGRTDIFPSWYSKNQGIRGQKMAFDTVSKKRATNCTPAHVRTELTVQKVMDPVTRRETLIAPSGYDVTKQDDIHKCNDVKPFVSSITAEQVGTTGQYKITANVNKGTHPLKTVEIKVDGQTIASFSARGGASYSKLHTFTTAGSHTITVVVRDAAEYETTSSQSLTVTLNNGGNGDPGGGGGNPLE